MLFSKTTGGFYDPNINSDIPADAVSISPETHTALLAGQSSGQVISSDSSGNPLLVTAASLMTLTQAQAYQNNILTLAYQSAITQPVDYNGLLYQTDSNSVHNLQASIAGCMSTQVTPTGFYWVSANNTQVPFAYSDLVALAALIFQQGAVAFQHLQSKKAQVNAATNISIVLGIVW